MIVVSKEKERPRTAGMSSQAHPPGLQFFSFLLLCVERWRDDSGKITILIGTYWACIFFHTATQKGKGGSRRIRLREMEDVSISISRSPPLDTHIKPVQLWSVFHFFFFSFKSCYDLLCHSLSLAIILLRPPTVYSFSFTFLFSLYMYDNMIATLVIWPFTQILIISINLFRHKTQT